MLTTIRLDNRVISIERYVNNDGRHYVIGVECSTETDPDMPFNERDCEPYIDWRPVQSIDSIRNEVSDVSKVCRVLSVSPKDYYRLRKSIHG